MEPEKGKPSELSEKKAWLMWPRAFVYLIVAMIVCASVVTTGWALMHHTRGLVFAVSTDGLVYTPGQPVQILTTFTNNGLNSVLLTFNTSQMARYTVYASDGSYVCGIRIIALQVITKKTIKPGESIEFAVGWDQTIDDPYKLKGDQAPYPGDYYVIAETMSLEYKSTARTLTFTISALPAT